MSDVGDDVAAFLYRDGALASSSTECPTAGLAARPGSS